MTKSLQKGYIPALDGLRALSIILVLLAHLQFYHGMPGSFGVTVFFFVSGFLITGLLLKEYERKNTIDFKNFYIRRILRLYPALLALILLNIVLSNFGYVTLNKQALFAALFYYQNYFYLFSPFHLRSFRSLWSLAVEEHFYLLFPWIFILTVKRFKTIVSVIIAIIIISLCSRLLITHFWGINDFAKEYTYTATECRADSILYGCLSAVLIYFNAEFYNRLYLSVVAFIIAFIALFLSLANQRQYFDQTFIYTVQGLSLFIIVPALVYNNKLITFNKFLSSGIMTFIGRLSYSLYLFHPVGYWLAEQMIPHKSVLQMILCVIVSFILAFLSYTLIETPVMSVRKKFGSIAVT